MKQLAQNASCEAKIKASKRVIVAAVMSSAAVGATPIPFSDAFLLMPLEFSLITSLAYIWNIDLSAKSLATLGLSQLVFSQITAKSFTSLLKLRPGIGTAIGGAINAIVSSSLTLAIGATYCSGFRTAWEKGWTKEGPEKLKERLSTVISFESLKETMSNIKNPTSVLTDKGMDDLLNKTK
jgi:uncharacterized protein (DUF697 family)